MVNGWFGLVIWDFRLTPKPIAVCICWYSSFITLDVLFFWGECPLDSSVFFLWGGGKNRDSSESYSPKLSSNCCSSLRVLVYPQILKATDLDLLAAVAKKALGCLPPVVTKITMSSWGFPSLTRLHPGKLASQDTDWIRREHANPNEIQVKIYDFSHQGVS